MSKAVYFKEVDATTVFAEVKSKRAVVDQRTVYGLKGGPLIVQTSQVEFVRLDKGYLYVKLSADLLAWVEALEKASQEAFSAFVGDDCKFVSQLVDDGSVLKVQNVADYVEDRDCGFDDLKVGEPLACLLRVEGLTTRSHYKGLIFYCDRVRSPKRKASWLPAEEEDDQSL